MGVDYYNYYYYLINLNAVNVWTLWLYLSHHAFCYSFRSPALTQRPLYCSWMDFLSAYCFRDRTLIKIVNEDFIYHVKPEHIAQNNNLPVQLLDYTQTHTHWEVMRAMKTITEDIGNSCYMLQINTCFLSWLIGGHTIDFCCFSLYKDNYAISPQGGTRSHGNHSHANILVLSTVLACVMLLSYNSKLKLSN